jgi:hypothetical protein
MDPIFSKLELQKLHSAIPIRKTGTQNSTMR